MNPGKTRVVIAGGGTAGWLAAYSLVKRLGTQLEITLVESDLIGTVGVGEATIPTMKSFHSLMEIDEREFMVGHAGHLQARHLVRQLGQHRRQLHPLIWCHRPGILDGRVP